MEKILITILAIIVLPSCEYKLNDKVMYSSDGNFYKLEIAPCENCYRLRLIDTTQLNTIKRHLKQDD